MGRFKINLAIRVAVLALSLLACGGARAEVLLGASFGYTHVSYPDVPGFTNSVVGIPGRELWGQPGFRLGYCTPGMRWGMNVDIGLDRNSVPSGTETTFEVLPQIEARMGPGRNGYSAFVNGGVGFEHESNLSVGPVGASRPAFGGGLGVRKSVSGGHGSVRVEVRYDHLPKVVVLEGGGFSPVEVTFLARNMISIKLGFDLLQSR